MQLMHESLTDALREVVSALGGPKAVGTALKPELPADTAGNWVRDCLNDARREKFSLDQLLWLLREGRKRNAHGAMAFILRECGYAEPQPIEPDAEKLALMREFIEAQRAMETLARRMERAGVISNTVPGMVA